MGVEIHVGTRVTGVDERGIETNSVDPALQRIEAATKFWAAGVEASPLGRLVAEAAGAEIDRAGRVKVGPDCTLPGHPEVFIIGDLMSLDGLPGWRRSRSSPAATPQIRSCDESPATPRPAIPLPRPRNDGDDLTLPRDRGARRSARVGLHRVDLLARRPPRRADRFQEPDLGPLQLDGRVPERRTPAAGHHEATGLRPASAGSTKLPNRTRPAELAAVRRAPALPRRATDAGRGAAQ